MSFADPPQGEKPPASYSPRPSCSACPMYELNICNAVPPKDGRQGVQTALEKVRQHTRTAPARQVICRESELLDSVPVICSGWAAAVVVLSMNRRQVLSLLLGGDFVSTTLLVDWNPGYMVETITEVHYRTFDRAALQAAIFGNPDRSEKFCRRWIEEKQNSNGLIVDLGLRTAEERIVRLIWGLKNRLAARGLVESGARIPFPLRQHQIAAATGLTPVHVNKVLSDLRRRRLIELSDRELTILDEAGLEYFATAQ